MMQEAAKPPDGGWGWVVAFCSFVNHMFIFGLFFSMGVIYVSWLEEFGNNSSTTSWIISISASLCLLSGPIAGNVAARYGYRLTALVGGLLAGVGIILSYFATSIFYLIITFGVITGVGFGFVYLSSLAIVVVYFDEKRALASGIGISGVGIGSFLWPPVMNTLVENYGWRGCLLIVGGLALNMCVTGALMRPVIFKDSNHGKDKNVMEGEEENYADDEDEKKRSGKRFRNIVEYLGKGHQRTICVESVERLTEHLPTSTDEIVYRENKEGRISSKDPCIFLRSNDISASLTDQEGDGSELLTTRTEIIKYSKTDNDYNLDSCDTADKIVFNHHFLSHSDEFISLMADFYNKKLTPLNELPLLSKSAPTLKTILTEDCYIYPNSKSTPKSTSHQEADIASSGIRSQANHRRRRFSLSTWKQNAASIIRSNIEVVKDTGFLLISLSQVLVTSSALSPLIYMVDRAIDNGIDKAQGAWLVSCGGVGSLVGRLLFGVIADQCKNCNLMFHIVLLSATGVCTMLSPLCGGSFILHGAYAATFGFGFGATSTLIVVIVVDFVGLSKLATAFGILLCFAGIGYVVGLPFAGFIFDATQSYMICYVSQGFALTCSGLMLIPILRMRKGLCCGGPSHHMK